MQFRIVRAGMTLGLALGFLLPALAASAEFKLAVVDQRRALLSSNGGKAAESTLTQLEEKKKKELEPRSARCKKMQEEIEAQRFVLADADTGRYDDALVQVFHKRNLRAQMLLGPAGSAMARHLPIQMFRD